MNILRTLITVQLVLLWTAVQAQTFDNTHLIEDARNGDPQAQYTLAHLYLKGKGGIVFDVEEAVRLLEEAADGGHKEAAFDLAFLYLNGMKLAKDRVKALHWLTRSAEMGQVDAGRGAVVTPLKPVLAIVLAAVVTPFGGSAHRKTAKGKLRGRRAYSSHILEKKSPKRKRQLRPTAPVAKADERMLRDLGV